MELRRRGWIGLAVLVLISFIGSVSGTFAVTTQVITTNTNITSTSFASFSKSLNQFLFIASPYPLLFNKTNVWTASTATMPKPSPATSTTPLCASIVPTTDSTFYVAAVYPSSGGNSYLAFQKWTGTSWTTTATSNRLSSQPKLISASSTLVLIKLDSSLRAFSFPGMTQILDYGTQSSYFAVLKNTFVYIDTGNKNRLTYVTCTGGSCSTNVVSNNIYPTSIALGNNGIFVKKSGSSSITQYYNPSSWKSTTISSTSSTAGSPMSVDPDGNYLVVMDTAKNEVYSYYYNATGWFAFGCGKLNSTDSTSVFSYDTAGIVATSSGMSLLVFVDATSARNYTFIRQYDITCSSTSYGLTCKNCSCLYGTCNSSLWSLSGKCISGCTGPYYGPDCSTRCHCVNGVCSTGLNGTGFCTQCLASNSSSITGWYDRNCSTPCSCKMGVCDSGLHGTGLCTTCLPDYFNPTCSENCTHCHPYGCYDGIHGNDTCSNCGPQQYGPSCVPCLCVNGTCSSGPNGDGYCIQCQDNFYGNTCSEVCSCPETGICNGGINGDGTCSSCINSFSGPNCTIAPTCLYGTVNSGLDGDGTCSSCDPGYWGTNCDSLCPCLSTDGVCDQKTGLCTLCYSQSKYGPYCNITCSCQNGLCNSGIDGDGKCAFCNTNYFGLDCSSLCSCVHGVCDGQYGTGVCTSCIGAYSGILCNIPCNCTNGACTNDITGNGLCSSCNSNYYGPTCNRCLCNTTRGTCSSGPGGNGLCSSCRNGYYGPTCNMTANCTNGRVSDGPLGTGVCSSCYSNSFGPTCETCTCVNGTCNAGLGGTGLCTNCIPGFYGPNCDTPCECSAPYTYCNNSASLGGGCVNECKFKTHNCEQLCVSRQTAPNTGWVCGCRDGFRLANDTQCKACTIEFICVNNTVTLSGKNSSTIDTTITGDLKIVSGSVSITNSSVTGTLTVVDSSTQISGSYVVIGGSIITIGSSFNLTGSSVVNVNGNFVLTNGKLDVSGNSFINITGCVDLTNSTLVLQSQGTTSTIKVLETSSNCTVSRFSHVQLADSLTSSCTKATVTDTSTKREISFAVTYDDSACNQFPSWLIGTIAVAGFIVIVISVLLVANSKALKEFFFPFREAPPDYNE